MNAEIFLIFKIWLVDVFICIFSYKFTLRWPSPYLICFLLHGSGPHKRISDGQGVWLTLNSLRGPGWHNRLQN